MPHITKLVIKGFKSFARETTMHLDRHMSVVVGPNGSGKSNITDALCFVLGRLSIKSMRAAKASHLIFAGNKQFKRANEAYVELTFDNSDKTFALEESEIKIKRIVRKNGQSIYRINNTTKTRQEVLELLAQAGIDPHGFNIVLQGEIERFVKMPPEERRKVLEEVAGISVYEMRKSKSLRELEKTHEKLKQINAVLRERTNYMRNLENEREQAIKFKNLEETVKRCKASIIHKNMMEREKDLSAINKNIDLEKKQVEKKAELIEKTQKEIDLLNDKINAISKSIQKSSGVEQDTLLSEISVLKQDIAGTIARKENFENQLIELDRREKALIKAVEDSGNEIQEMRKEKGSNTKKQLEDKKTKLEELDELKRSSYLLKSNISSLNNQIEDKKKQIQRLKNESNFTLNQIEHLESEINIRESLEKQSQAIISLKASLEKNKEKVKVLEKNILENEKLIAINSQSIKRAEEIKAQVSKLDICPLCKTKITKDHIGHVVKKADDDTAKFKKHLNEADSIIKKTKADLDSLNREISNNSSEINNREIDTVKLNSINDKKEQLKRNANQEQDFEKELAVLGDKKRVADKKFSQIKISEGDYENLRLEVNELQRTEERNLGIEITTKQRELDRMQLAIKQIKRDKESIRQDFQELNDDLEEKQEKVEKKEEQAEIVKRKYQRMFEEKNNFQDKIRLFESNLLKTQNDKRLFENNINNFMINKAEAKAKKDNLTEELKEFEGIEFINQGIEKLKDRLRKSIEILSRIGNVNLRALEVYDGIKAEYDKIKEKVEQLEKEKEEILKVIGQIDRKKKRTFMNTLQEINKLFSRNFAQLSSKGTVTLEPQDKKDVFSAGLDIVVNVSVGKRFDVTSLSGGEQCLVALALIFAIQEHRPYCFYIFDEIDAALDKRNSERIAHLLRKYMKEGQYIIITHNDALISESSNVLYGVSMQEGISKILSLEV